MRHLLHDGLVGVIKSIPKDAGVPDVSVVVEARGLRATYHSRSNDIVALDFFAENRRLAIDAVVTTIYRNTILQNKVASFMGYVAKEAETESSWRTAPRANPSRLRTEAPT